MHQQKPLTPENTEKRLRDKAYLDKLRIEVQLLLEVGADEAEQREAIEEYKSALRYYVLKWGDRD